MDLFPIVFRDKIIEIDPASFAINSLKFRELFNPALAPFSEIDIIGNYQEKSVKIFCDLCQDKESPMPDNCMKDIANLAKIFKAESILDTCVRVIHSKIDGSFRPDDKGTIIFQDKRLASSKNLPLDSSKSHLSIEQLIVSDNKFDPQTSPNKATPQQSPSDVSLKYYLNDPIVYDIKEEKKLLKCTRYYESQKGEILASAKTRSNSIVINNGQDVHFHSINDSSADVQKLNYINIIRSDGNSHELRYYKDPKTGNVTMTIMFKIGSDDLIITGLRNMEKDDTTVFGSKTVVSAKQPCNLYLPNGKIAMIISKTGNDTYQIKTYLKTSNIFAFAVALSAIVGPHSTSDI